MFRYPWLVLGPGLLILSRVMAGPKASGRIAAHQLTDREWRSFMRGVVAAVLTYSLLVTLIQVAGGYGDFFCLMGFLPPRSIAGAAFWILQAAFVVAGLVWLWFGAGGEVLARVGPVFTRYTSADTVFDRRSVRIVVTVWLLASNLGAAGLVVRQAPDTERAAECGL